GNVVAVGQVDAVGGQTDVLCDHFYFIGGDDRANASFRFFEYTLGLFNTAAFGSNDMHAQLTAIYCREKVPADEGKQAVTGSVCEQETGCHQRPVLEEQLQQTMIAVS